MFLVYKRGFEFGLRNFVCPHAIFSSSVMVIVATDCRAREQLGTKCMGESNDRTRLTRRESCVVIGRYILGHGMEMNYKENFDCSILGLLILVVASS